MTTCTCTACKRPITDLETYGDIDCPLCWACHFSAMFDGDPPQMIDANIYAADAEAGYTRRHCEYCDRQQQEAAGQLRLL